MLKKINQYKEEREKERGERERERAVYGRKESHFEAEKRRKIDQSHWTKIGHSKHNIAKKETFGVLRNRYRTGRPRKTTAVDDRNIVRAVRKKPKTTVSDILNNLHRAGVKVSSSTVRRRLCERINIEAIPQDTKHSSAVRVGKPD